MLHSLTVVLYRLLVVTCLIRLLTICWLTRLLVISLIRELTIRWHTRLLVISCWLTVAIVHWLLFSWLPVFNRSFIWGITIHFTCIISCHNNSRWGNLHILIHNLSLSLSANAFANSTNNQDNSKDTVKSNIPLRPSIITTVEVAVIITGRTVASLAIVVVIGVSIRETSHNIYKI